MKVFSPFKVITRELKRAKDQSLSSDGGDYNENQKDIFLIGEKTPIGQIYSSSSQFGYCQLTGSHTETEIVETPIGTLEVGKGKMNPFSTDEDFLVFFGAPISNVAQRLKRAQEEERLRSYFSETNMSCRLTDREGQKTITVIDSAFNYWDFTLAFYAPKMTKEGSANPAKDSKAIETLLRWLNQEDYWMKESYIDLINETPNAQAQKRAWDKWVDVNINLTESNE